ncbi:hypothetical protein O181_016390 [Austropuccinia psidii MF-1]|uniref:Uncharacterized protein n=1 Tax=Austropuccinia psidii MF-1 TaxID=1389203 RepID=A0A9Q3C4R8_9BASI|nr:hypothetical protein [Austropuccinia psidii MF-1]
MSQPQRMTLLHLVLRKFQPETKLGPIGHNISFMANWPPLVLYDILAISGLRPYPAIIGPPGQSPLHQPPVLYFCFWAWGVPLSSRGFLAPYPSPLALGQPFSLGGLGPNWPFWAI